MAAVCNSSTWTTENDGAGEERSIGMEDRLVGLQAAEAGSNCAVRAWWVYENAANKSLKPTPGATSRFRIRG